MLTNTTCDSAAGIAPASPTNAAVQIIQRTAFFMMFPLPFA